jgi:hypothetical protein
MGRRLSETSLERMRRENDEEEQEIRARELRARKQALKAPTAPNPPAQKWRTETPPPKGRRKVGPGTIVAFLCYDAFLAAGKPRDPTVSATELAAQIIEAGIAAWIEGADQLETDGPLWHLCEALLNRWRREAGKASSAPAAPTAPTATMKRQR